MMLILNRKLPKNKFVCESAGEAMVDQSSLQTYDVTSQVFRVPQRVFYGYALGPLKYTMLTVRVHQSDRAGVLFPIYHSIAR